MALRVWLPLNGNLENKGISDYEIRSANITIADDGKIGKCYSFNGSNSYINITNFEIGNNWSYGCWVNTPNSDSRGWEIVMILNNSGSDADSQFAFWVHQKENRFESLANTQYVSTIPYTNYYNNWHHFFATFNGTLLTTYIDGNVVNTKTITATQYNAVNLTIGARSTNAAGTSFASWFQGKLNDIRVYDHCLSLLEVKEISRGLVLHYKLDGLNGGAGENLFSDTNQGASHWTQSYGNGAGSLSSDGVEAKYDITTQATNWQVFGFRPSNNADVMAALSVAGETYTLSFDIFATSAFSTSPTYRDGNSSNNLITWPTLNALANQWTHYEGTAITTGGTISNQELYINYKVPVGTYRFKNLKLEKGPIATSWMPASLEMGIDTSKITDSSGYGNDGIIINTISTEQNSPRYQIATHISSTSSKIRIDNLQTSGFGNSYTFAWWAKISSVTPMHWGFANGIRLNGMYTGRLWNTGDSGNNPLYNPGTTTQVTAPTINTWHHWVMTGNGTKCLVYQDGQLWAEAKTYKAISGTTIYINGWDASTSYSSDNYSISDFRIYATALSAEDILDLYHTPANIDNLGGIHGFEFIEKEGNSFATELLGNYNSTSANWDSQNNQFTIVSPNGTGSRYGLVIKNANSRRLIPWGYTYRFTFDIYVPITTNFNVDYNNYSNDSSVSLSGNDNDDTSKRLSASFTVNANTWTTVTLGSSNTSESKNPNHVTLYDQTNFGIKTDSATAPVTWYLKNPQWYLIDTNESTNYQVYQNGIFKNNFIKQDDTNDFASFRNKEKATWGSNFIEK